MNDDRIILSGNVRTLHGARGRIRTDVPVKVPLTKRVQSTAMRLGRERGTGLEPATFNLEN